MSNFFTEDSLDAFDSASDSESEIIQQLLLRMRAPAGALPKFDSSILDDCNDSLFDESDPNSMKWLGPSTCMALFDIGRNPKPKVVYQDMTTLSLFSDGSLIVWYIPHPSHQMAAIECLQGLNSGRFTHAVDVQIPTEVLKMSKCWRC
jgi:hypothetical protein